MPAQHELSITRFIDAPPEAVYRVWTERTGEWWCPRPWTTPVVEWDLKAGGRAFTVMRSPEGEDMPPDGIFLEVVPNEDRQRGVQGKRGPERVEIGGRGKV